MKRNVHKRCRTGQFGTDNKTQSRRTLPQATGIQLENKGQVHIAETL